MSFSLDSAAHGAHWSFFYQAVLICDPEMSCYDLFTVNAGCVTLPGWRALWTVRDTLSGNQQIKQIDSEALCTEFVCLSEFS